MAMILASCAQLLVAYIAIPVGKDGLTQAAYEHTRMRSAVNTLRMLSIISCSVSQARQLVDTQAIPMLYALAAWSDTGFRALPRELHQHPMLPSCSAGTHLLCCS